MPGPVGVLTAAAALTMARPADGRSLKESGWSVDDRMRSVETGLSGFEDSMSAVRTRATARVSPIE